MKIGVLPLLLSSATALWAADHPTPAEFAWRAALTVPAGASVARVTLPADAMLRLQSPDARDVRVFNAQGAPVAFAWAPHSVSAPSTPPQSTRVYTAYPLFTATSGQSPAKGSVAVQMDQTGTHNTVWVRFSQSDPSRASGTADPGPSVLPSVLFDTRSEKHTITALSLRAALPANALLHFSLASSTDLAHWTPVAVKGPVFRFDGDGAPANQTLELVQPLSLENHYLRLSWPQHSGVQVSGFTGALAQVAQPRPRLRADLPAGVADGNASVQWPLPFATPIAALRLSTTRDNTLVPVRVLGRNDAAQPWRVLTQGVVFRLGGTGADATPPALPLGGASVRQLKVEALKGMPLPSPDLHASVEFEPLELAFLASGTGPFELAVGRANTPAAAIDATLLTQAVQGQLAALPSADLTHVRIQSAAPSALQQALPAGAEPRSVALWVVLLAGVLILASVAYALMRQLSRKPS